MNFQVLCSVTQICIVVLGMGNLRKKILVPKIIDRPNEFFIMAEAICIFFYIFVFIYMFLRKKKDLLIIMESSLKCKDNETNAKVSFDWGWRLPDIISLN